MAAFGSSNAGPKASRTTGCGPGSAWELVAFEMSEGPSVAVSQRATIHGQKRRLFGLNQIQDDRGRAAVLAVLSATNRLFGT